MRIRTRKAKKMIPMKFSNPWKGDPKKTRQTVDFYPDIPAEEGKARDLGDSRGRMSL
jgi:hypothetical protein